MVRSRCSPISPTPPPSCARSMTREVELKSVVTDEGDSRRRLETAGGRLTFEGRLEDRRYDTTDRRLTASDEVLRLRSYVGGSSGRATIEWKGPTRLEGG